MRPKTYLKLYTSIGTLLMWHIYCVVSQSWTYSQLTKNLNRRHCWKGKILLQHTAVWALMELLPLFRRPRIGCPPSTAKQRAKIQTQQCCKGLMVRQTYTKQCCGGFMFRPTRLDFDLTWSFFVCFEPKSFFFFFKSSKTNQKFD